MTTKSPPRASSKPAAISPPPDGQCIDLGTTVCRWIESNLVHGEGDFYGEPWVLDPWQREFIRRLYLSYPKTKENDELDRSYRRLVRSALLILPRGMGKTEMIAAIMLAELAGPTMLSKAGKATLRPSPNIPVAAASFEQSARLFGAAQAMADSDAANVRPFLDIRERQMRRKGGPGKLFRLTAVADTNEGGLPTAFGADELHAWDKESVRRVHLVLESGLTKRKDGLGLNISTPDDAQPDSLLGGMVAYGEQVASGEVVDPSFLYVRYSAKEDYDLDDPDELRAAIREASPASWMDVERIAARYEVDRMPKHEFCRYHLAQFVRPSKYWLPAGAWEPLKRERKIAPGEDVVLGFDGSYNRDASALIACTMDGFLQVLEVWERPEKAPETWSIPRSEVDAAVAKAMDSFHVRELACDPHRWTQEIQQWAEEWGTTVLDFPTNTPSRMAPACSRFYAAVVSGEGLTHDGNPVLARHLMNCIVKEQRDGAVVTKEGRDSPRKIDAAVAAIIAFERAKVLAGIAEATSVYEERGPAFIG